MTTTAERALRFAKTLDDFEENEIVYLCDDTRADVHAVLAAAGVTPKSAMVRAAVIPPRRMSEREASEDTAQRRALETPEQRAQREIDTEAGREIVRGEKRRKAIHDAAWWGVVLADIGRARPELSPEARVGAAYKLADMVAESVGRLGVVPPGTAFELEAVELRAEPIFNGMPIRPMAEISTIDLLIAVNWKLGESGPDQAALDLLEQVLAVHRPQSLVSKANG